VATVHVLSENGVAHSDNWAPILIVLRFIGPFIWNS